MTTATSSVAKGLVRRAQAMGAAGTALALVSGLMYAAPAAAGNSPPVTGAAFTTTNLAVDDPEGNQDICLNGRMAVDANNCNIYTDKSYVWLNGGPATAYVGDGSYFFAVLQPGGQPNPNDGGAKNLSDTTAAPWDADAKNADGSAVGSGDSYQDRAFTVSGGEVSYTGPHDFVNNKIRLMPYDDTPNNGGVYILAICSLDADYPVKPSRCKYDAFKVRSGDDGGDDPGFDLIAVKDAHTSYKSTFTWDVEKSVDKTFVSQLGGEAVFNYTVAWTKHLVGHSEFALRGSVTVVNPNDTAATGVTVTDETLGVTCAVEGGNDTIAARGSETFTYSCGMDAAAGVSPSTADTNVATVTWDKSSIGSVNESTSAEAPYDFANASVTTVGDTTDVTDSFNGAAPMVLKFGVSGSGSTSYPKSIPVPANNCVNYTNTAVVTQSGDSDSETVRVCGPNSDGYTIGFWKNNSARLITSTTAGAYCAAIKSYPAVLTGLTCTAGSAGNTAANAKAINTWVAKTMAEGEASGTGAPMFKAQFLATTLNVQRTPALGATTVLLTDAEKAALSGKVNNCAAVSEVLFHGNATYSTLSKTKIDFMLVKDVFDRINNNIQLTC